MRKLWFGFYAPAEKKTEAAAAPEAQDATETRQRLATATDQLKYITVRACPLCGCAEVRRVELEMELDRGARESERRERWHEHLRFACGAWYFYGGALPLQDESRSCKRDPKSLAACRKIEIGDKITVAVCRALEEMRDDFSAGFVGELQHVIMSAARQWVADKIVEAEKREQKMPKSAGA